MLRYSQDHKTWEQDEIHVEWQNRNFHCTVSAMSRKIRHVAGYVYYRADQLCEDKPEDRPEQNLSDRFINGRRRNLKIHINSSRSAKTTGRCCNHLFAVYFF